MKSVKRWMMGGALVAGLLVGGPGGAGAQQPRSKTLQKAVAACVAVVREKGSIKDASGKVLWDNGFDAYVKYGSTTIMSFGSPEERFKFEKCLDEGGWL